jgi:uncharacterized metal-binding protein YceD (DUF177 family)
MNPLNKYNIKFIGLKDGIHNFDFRIDNKFFDIFNYTEFNNCNIKSIVQLDKKLNLLKLNFYSKGFININCDLSNEPFDCLIDQKYQIVVKFGDKFNNDHDEITILEHGSYKVNIAQYLYEMIVLSVPIKKLHPGIKKGTLKSNILKRLEELSPKSNIKVKDPRWDKLKDLL